MTGKAHKYGDNIDTDVIIPARYCTSFHIEELAPHCLEDLDPDFVKKVSEGDILVTGENFGCGSSRENAPIAIKGAGISCVVAKSFARIFYRNAINIALPIFENREFVDITDTGDWIKVDLKKGFIENETKGKRFKISLFPDIIQEIIECGGMIGFVKKRIEAKRKSKE
ncbi:3-isopropylmalate dehydratase small subunit [candidate division KSB1 bacterium]|nr:MAG: 3-isopropylmalate dehydratase small subunit [candidate division KSB1 bacterium]